jgi:hypothetical protein
MSAVRRLNMVARRSGRLGLIIGLGSLFVASALLLAFGLNRGAVNKPPAVAIRHALQVVSSPYVLGAQGAGPTWIMSGAIRDVSPSPIMVRRVGFKVYAGVHIDYVGWVQYANERQALESSVALGGGQYGWNVEFGEHILIRNAVAHPRLVQGRVYQLLIAWSLSPSWQPSATQDLFLSVRCRGVNWTVAVPLETELCPIPSRDGPCRA